MVPSDATSSHRPITTAPTMPAVCAFPSSDAAAISPRVKSKMVAIVVTPIKMTWSRM